VQISSNRKNCPSGASFSIAIERGQVASTGGMFNASGRVADTGIINVVLSSGLKRASGLGHLSADAGSGTWHGEQLRHLDRQPRRRGIQRVFDWIK